VKPGFLASHKNRDLENLFAEDPVNSILFFDVLQIPFFTVE